jgi:hypothetical protein
LRILEFFVGALVSATSESLSCGVQLVSRILRWVVSICDANRTLFSCSSGSSSHFIFRYMLFILFALVTVWFSAILLVRRRTFVRLLLHDLALSNATGDFDLQLEAGELAIDPPFFNYVLVSSLGDM